MATARFDMRLDERIKTKAEKARALLGLKSLSDYVAKLIDDDATRVIAEHEGITLADDTFDRFISACEGAINAGQKIRRFGRLESTQARPV